MITILIKGEAVGKGRPRIYRNKGITRAVTPEKTRSYEEKVKAAYREKYGNALPYPEEALKVQMLIGIGIPKSTGKKKREEMLEGKIRPSKKPDIDNVIKSVLDALNGEAYSDDKQIVEIRAVKYYTSEPFVLLEIEEAEEEADGRKEKLCNV